MRWSSPREIGLFSRWWISRQHIPAAAVLPKFTLTYEMWPADIHQLCGQWRLLSSRDISSTVWPFMAAIQARSSVNRVAFHGCYQVKIFYQQGGLAWLLSSRDLQSTGWPFMAAFQSRSSVNRVAIHSCYPVEIFSQQGGLSLNPLWCPSASAILMLSAKQIFKR